MTGSRDKKHDLGELAIALFKWIKGALLLALAVGALSVVHKDAAEILSYRIGQLGFDPDSRYASKMIVKLGFASDHDIVLASIITFVYAAVFIVEGFGLYFQKIWGEYLTIIVTSSFIPLEIYELTRHISIFKILIIITNVATVIYLIWRLRKRKREQPTK